MLGDLLPGRARPDELIASLNDVADAVSSAMSVEDVLEVIVERAKWVTDTDKAVLVLADEQEHIDPSTIVVRGKRDRHMQEWWQERIESLEDSIFQSHDAVVEHHPEHHATLVVCPIRVRSHPIGVLAAINSSERGFTRDHLDFLAILTAFAASAIENARLAEQSRYVLLASERDRIAREMHDGVVQSLFSITLGLEVCKKQVTRDPAGVAIRLDEIQSHVTTSMTELRRFIYDLRPMKLAELGLIGATEYWIREVTLGKSLRGNLLVTGEAPRLTPSEEACLYRVAKEAVSNVVKHAQADSFEVRLAFRSDLVTLVIQDDGVGFDVEVVMERLGSAGLGLRSIRERVAREGGRLRVESAPGAGTMIAVELTTGG